MSLLLKNADIINADTRYTADILCEGHYGVFSGKAAVADFIERFIA